MRLPQRRGESEKVLRALIECRRDVGFQAPCRYALAYVLSIGAMALSALLLLLSQLQVGSNPSTSAIELSHRTCPQVDSVSISAELAADASVSALSGSISVGSGSLTAVGSSFHDFWWPFRCSEG